MSYSTLKFSLLILTVFLVAACSTLKKEKPENPTAYKPDSQELYDQVVKLDSIFFNAYNTCDMDLQAKFYSDSIEFYHDKTGLSTSKKDVLEATKKNICGKVTRELVKGSIEVYPLKGFGAVEIGMQKFHNNMEKQSTPSHAGKFIMIWQQTGNDWKIKRVVSLH
jgi:ketosteroid isomerase-like protein